MKIFLVIFGLLLLFSLYSCDNPQGYTYVPPSDTCYKGDMFIYSNTSHLYYVQIQYNGYSYLYGPTNPNFYSNSNVLFLGLQNIKILYQSDVIIDTTVFINGCDSLFFNLN